VEFKFTRDYAIDTKLEGSQLLQKDLNTKNVIKGYVNLVMEDRGSKEIKRHDSTKYRYYWMDPTQKTPQLAKMAGEDLLLPIRLRMLGIMQAPN